LTLLVGRQEGHPACKRTQRWGAGVVICLERGADLHTAQLMPLTLTISCFSEIRIGLASLVPAHLGGPRQRAVKRMCVCVFSTRRYQSAAAAAAGLLLWAYVGTDKRTDKQDRRTDRWKDGHHTVT